MVSVIYYASVRDDGLGYRDIYIITPKGNGERTNQSAAG